MKETFQISKIHSTTLEFEKRSTEKKYIYETLPFNLKTFRIICIIAFSVHFVYFVKDFFWTYNDAVPIRAFVIIPGFILGYLISKLSIVKNQVNHFYKLAIIIVLFAVFTQLLIAWINPTVHTQISHSIPIIFYGTYIFVGVKFKHLLYFLGPITFIIPLLFMWILMDYEFGQKIDASIILTVNYFIATFAKYNLELFHRSNFSKKEIRNVQQDLIVEYNQELHLQKELYRGLTERSDDMITIRALDGSIDFVSHASENLLGYKPEELIGTMADNLIYEEDLETMRNKVRKELNAGKHTQWEYRMIHKSGKKVWVQSIGMPIMDENNSVISIQGSTRDISYKKEIELKLKETKEYLEELNAQKNRFFSIISHDLRGPFNNVVSLSNLLGDHIDTYSREEITQIVNHLETAASSSKDLLDNLLTWSKTQLDGIVVSKSYVNLNEIVSLNIDLLTPLADQKKIALSSDIDKRLMIYADIEMIKTVVRNLISNAIKFSQIEKMVKIYTRNKTEETVEIVVEDSGVGISKERIDRLFRLDTKETTLGTNRESGTGLGLIICKDFVEQNNGEIGIESKVNFGTKIFFRMALAKFD